MRLLTILLCLSAPAYAALQSPFLPQVTSNTVAPKAPVAPPEAPSLPAEDITYFDSKPEGIALVATIIEHDATLMVDDAPLKTVMLNEGQRITTTTNTAAECSVAGVHMRMWENSLLALSTMRSFDHHSEIDITFTQGRLRLMPKSSFVGGISVQTPDAKIISYNAHCMVLIGATATVWNLNGAVEIITETQKLILMPGERADRRGSVWSVSALLNPESKDKLIQQFALRSEQASSVVKISSSRHYVKTKGDSPQP